MDELSLRGPVVVDNVLDEHSRSMLLQRFPSLPPENRQVRQNLLVPAELQQRIADIVEWCIIGDDPSEKDWKPISAHVAQSHVPMPVKVSVGSSRAMHQDTQFDANGQFEETIVKGYVAVLYLEGDGEMVFDSGLGEHAIQVTPGRLILWFNESCKHRVEASADGRARCMLGPMYISPDGLVQAVGHMGTLTETGRTGPPPAPPPNVMITVTKVGAFWSCTSLSGDEVARIGCEGDPHGTPWNPPLSEAGLRGQVWQALVNKDVNVVLLDPSGTEFKMDVCDANQEGEGEEGEEGLRDANQAGEGEEGSGQREGPGDEDRHGHLQP